MNLFTLGGANEFTFVISRAPARKEDTLQSVSTRLTRELKANLPELSIIKVELTELDGIPALELFYSFTSGQRTLLQKQRAVLLDDAFQGKSCCALSAPRPMRSMLRIHGFTISSPPLIKHDIHLKCCVAKPLLY